MFKSGFGSSTSKVVERACCTCLGLEVEQVEKGE